MGTINRGAYASILRTREAYCFDAGTFLMRLFSYTLTIGPITMLTLAGASAFEASSVASLIAICMFFVAPRVSRRIDERGQSAVVPKATAVAMAGFVLMLCTTQFGWPFWLNYVAAPFASFLPNAQAFARTRWTFLISTGKLGDDAPPLKTAYAFEGILEDIAFMIGPASVIALSTLVAPTMGIFCGALAYCVGTVLLLSSKDTEPEPGWGTHPQQASGKSVLRTSSVVRVLFVVMILYGAIFGSFDTSAISFTESTDDASWASVVFAAESVCSVAMSVLFGMLGLASPLRKQFVVFTTLFGLFYALFAFVDSPTSLLAIACISALSYAPMYITVNVTCERAVPSANLTEAISWLASGSSIGMVIGPVAAGIVVDAFGPLAGFNLTATFALAVVVVVLASIPLMRKHLP